MNFSDILFFIIAVMAVIGAIDRFFNGKFGLGAEYENGFNAMGPLALVMVGVSCLSPYLERLIYSYVSPFFVALGADPSVALAVFISADSGCYPLAIKMALDPKTAVFVTFLLASTLTPALQFMMPVGLMNISKEYIPALAIGCIAGLVAIPLGAIPGGLMLRMSVFSILKNLIPVILMDLIIIVGLMLSSERTIAFFAFYAKAFSAVIAFGVSAALFQDLTGIIIFKELFPAQDMFVTIGDIAFVLAGVYPLLKLIRMALKNRIAALAKLLGTNEYAVIGMIGALANCFAMTIYLRKMDMRGVAINIAFACGAGWVFGDFLGYCAAVSPSSLAPMIVGKLVIAGIAVMIASFLCDRILSKTVDNRRKHSGDMSSAF